MRGVNLVPFSLINGDYPVTQLVIEVGPRTTNRSRPFVRNTWFFLIALDRVTAKHRRGHSFTNRAVRVGERNHNRHLTFPNLRLNGPTVVGGSNPSRLCIVEVRPWSTPNYLAHHYGHR